VTVVLYIGLFLLLGYLFWRSRMGPKASSSAMAFGRSRGRQVRPDDDKPKTTFADVAGVDEAKEELEEVVRFLKTPEKYTRLGARIPKGVLLVGPPGTGKTLLARAVAGEASVPFISISGSEFVEMFVGVGAARVRDLFQQARDNAPCIVFIDELDALGRSRNAIPGAPSHEEREQTLNQLLVEMDGFSPTDGVILMAATNRPDVLDPALLRPGRFDRHVVVDRPDRAGREAILAIHVRGVTLGKDVKLATLAARTPGFAGADLASLVNEAALLSARRELEAVDMQAFSDALDRVIAGLEKKNRLISEPEKWRTAYHEVGHALAAVLSGSDDVVHKISIIPRGMALGFTMQLPDEERLSYTKGLLEAKLVGILGGRAAEEVMYGEPSTGAQNDLQKATAIARAMVVEHGMSDAVGPISVSRRRSPFLGDQAGSDGPDIGERLADAIDGEVRRLVEAALTRARTLLEQNRASLERIARRVFESESLEGDELTGLLAEAKAEHDARTALH
jgi:cell division protease FtsH